VFDFGTCYHISEPAAALSEIERVLAPGGRFVTETRLNQLVSHPVRSWGPVVAVGCGAATAFGSRHAHVDGARQAGAAVMLLLRLQPPLPDASVEVEWGVRGVFAVATVDGVVIRQCLVGPSRWLPVLVPMTRVWRTTRIADRLLLWLRPHPEGLPFALEGLAAARRPPRTSSRP
jgi:hypothetical protein